MREAGRLISAPTRHGVEPRAEDEGHHGGERRHPIGMQSRRRFLSPFALVGLLIGGSLLASSASAAPQLVRDLRLDGVRAIEDLAAVGDQLFLLVRGAGFRQEIWESDGTFDGTRRIFAAASDATTTPFGESLIPRGSRLCFFRRAADGVTWELWALDLETEVAEEVAPIPGIGFFSWMLAGDRVVFSNDGIKLWGSDCTTSGTEVVFESENVMQLLYGFETPDRALLSLVESATVPLRLWSSDGTAAGTTPVMTLEGATLDDAFPTGHLADGKAYVTQFADGLEHWFTDGTPEGTLQVLGLEANSSLVATTRRQAFFTDLDLGRLWSYEIGDRPQLVWETSAVLRGLGSPLEGTENRSELHFFREDNFLDPWRLLVTDGSAAGTKVVFQDPGSAETTQPFVSIDGHLYWTLAVDGRRELWRSNGSAASTRKVAPGLDAAEIVFAPQVGGVIVRNGRDESNSSLWYAPQNGGAFLLVELQNQRLSLPGSAVIGLTPSPMVATDSSIFFVTVEQVPAGRIELWSLPLDSLDGPALALRTDDRFEVRVRWTKPNGESGFGTPERLTTDTGSFYFFRASNVELMVKILDGRNANGHFWVFYGALSNVAYEVTVTDTETGAVKVYENPQGSFGSVGDTRAFPAPGTSSAPVPEGLGTLAALEASLDALVPPGLDATRPRPAAAPTKMGCATTDAALCLQQERFTVSVEWRKPNGEVGAGTARTLSPDSGYFYFFRESNIELMVKILDGRNSNGHFWVFYGALSNLFYRITVTDTETGAVKVYENPAGEFGSVGDTRAFAVP